MKYEFSVPMPENTDDIKSLFEINNKVEKSCIKSLYYALNCACIDNTGFEQLRTKNNSIEGLDKYLKLIEYTKELGFDFIYLLISPKPILYESKYTKYQFEKLDRLINKLKAIGCNKYRVGNVHLIDYLQQNYPDLELYASTSFEYQTIKQYSTFLELYPCIKEIVPAVDLNKNFKFLKNFRKMFPDVTIELMVNEGCLYSCPLRYQHNTSLPYWIETKHEINKQFNVNYFINKCNNYFLENNKFFHIFNHNIIYPWEIEEYVNIGINNFKLVGRNNSNNIKKKYIDYYLFYLEGIDNYKNIEEKPIYMFNNYIVISEYPYKIKDIKKYLPNIQYFKEHGHLCSSECEIECKYCYDCAEKFKKELLK